MRWEDVRAKMVEEYGITEFTCDGCKLRASCPSAYDPYNIDGDCLEEK